MVKIKSELCDQISSSSSTVRMPFPWLTGSQMGLVEAPTFPYKESERLSFQDVGLSIGMKVAQTPLDIVRLEAEAAGIFERQNLHVAVVKNFLVPQLNFNLRSLRIAMSGFRGLLTSGSVAPPGLIPSRGGAGFLLLADQGDPAAVSHAFRLLSSSRLRDTLHLLKSLAVSAGQRIAMGAGSLILANVSLFMLGFRVTIL
ncbi:hypothetical protein J6590_000706 [Homalodisca vitripennis]|nr:hypothetical protein J6590_000706 [Homalodisca vitripennis]